MPRTQFIASISLISLASLALFVPIVWAQVRLFGQCGGVGYTGPTTCVSGCIGQPQQAIISTEPAEMTCFSLPSFAVFVLLVPIVLAQTPTTAPLFGQCGGKGYTGPTKCVTGYSSTVICLLAFLLI
ncbi:hypothetical protein BDQ12DRAFT_722289 [Crucibulum laeve]|uniref:CBM1 domain-containing protein n=1 Tax=Crucibulum laeve TaxID=68775 RepID=A0A5C3M6D4_9AGAR|nr:hypothetical protein BDQ12DRAFT_722289 [Crucibulum laeve]